ncbi:hypothetical protein BHE74_00043702 [Ensete ventricosum]|nr:hypothetical protein BHE74_00043702 [Ensete ventricosum]
MGLYRVITVDILTITIGNKLVTVDFGCHRPLGPVSAWLRQRKKKHQGRRKKKETGEPQCIPIRRRPPLMIPIQEVTARQRLGFFFIVFFAEGRRCLRLSTSSPNVANEETKIMFSLFEPLRRRGGCDIIEV